MGLPVRTAAIILLGSLVLWSTPAVARDSRFFTLLLVQWGLWVLPLRMGGGTFTYAAVQLTSALFAFGWLSYALGQWSMTLISSSPAGKLVVSFIAATLPLCFSVFFGPPRQTGR